MAYETFETIQRFWQRFAARSSRACRPTSGAVAPSSKPASATCCKGAAGDDGTAFSDLVGLGKDGSPLRRHSLAEARRRFRRRRRSQPAARRRGAVLHLSARANGRVPGRRGAAPALSRRPHAHPARPRRARPLSPREVAAAALRAEGPAGRLYARLQLRQGAAARRAPSSTSTSTTSSSH